MGALMRAHDWPKTALGPVEHWPKSLRIAVRILLGSGYPMYIAWGSHFLQLYNDAYRPILGTVKHPAALGSPTPATFPEIWELIGPMFRRVMTEGVATTVTDQLLLLDRNGYTEEAYFTFSYSAIPSDDEEVAGGVLVTCLETTDRLLEERRLRTLRDLAAETSGLTTERQVCEVAARSLGRNLHDLPVTLMYLRDSGALRLASSSGVAGGQSYTGNLDEEFWPISQVVEGRSPLVVRDVDSKLGILLAGPWKVPVRDAVLCPLLTSAGEEPIGFLIVGLNPRRAFDGAYATFLERVAAQISTSINDVRAYESERHRAEALAELDRAKTTFFSNISHEFRTPLTLMIGPMEEILASGEALPPEVVPRVEIAYRSALRLLKLVNNLLDFSRLEAGRIQAIYEPIDLPQFTADLASSFRAAIERAGLRFNIDCEPLRDAVFVDREMWEKVVLNLLSNAFKFTFEGAIVVAQRQVGPDVELIISDTGTGISESELPNLFKRFYRIEGARGRSYEGSGIGLALVHELVKLHGGNIRVQTELGKGSSFIVTVPTGFAHLPAEHLGRTRKSVSTATRTEMFVNESLRWVPEDEASFAINDSSLGSDKALTSQAPPSLKGPRILIVDDNADMREYLARLLSHAFVIQAAADGVEALGAIRRQRPDLVISDVMMPQMSGLELLKAVRRDPSLQRLPMILLSARADEQHRIQGLEAGADDYVTKPFTARELMARISARLEIARLRAESEEQAHRDASKVQGMLESTTDAVFMLDRDWRFIYLNKNAVEQIAHGRPLLGRNVWEEFPDAVSREFYKQYHRVMHDRVHVEFEEYYPAPLDKWFGVHAYPTEDGIAVFFRDTTERRKAEVALRQSEKLAVVGRLAASIAHEINNPLESVTNLLYLLESSPSLQDRDRSYLKTAQSELARVSHIAARTLRFYRQSSKPSETSIQELLDSVIDLFQPRLDSAGISVQRRYKAAAPLMGYAGELRQVFANLLANALDATARGGKISVGVRNSQRWTDGTRGIRVTISDTGHGMTAEVQKRLFEPFFSTKESTGTGLGLWVSRGIIDKHNGSTRVRSSCEPHRRGTTFSIFLPASFSTEEPTAATISE